MKTLPNVVSLFQVGGHGISRGVPTATSSTSPLSARELVEISLLQEPEADADITAGCSIFGHRILLFYYCFYFKIPAYFLWLHRDRSFRTLR